MRDNCTQQLHAHQQPLVRCITCTWCDRLLRYCLMHKMYVICFADCLRMSVSVTLSKSSMHIMVYMCVYAVCETSTSRCMYVHLLCRCTSSSAVVEPSTVLWSIWKNRLQSHKYGASLATRYGRLISCTNTKWFTVISRRETFCSPWMDRSN